ncbi:Holliday junction resolvase RecU [Bacillus suaedae]|uniref:Holliday junction resolvase RecU n=1 Tax=Halalkalibacter suaedae TaxID=2822140 RepID=A0A940WPK6_9BACI|nr:Holliday junction resolvase RecU [Bacillus suaedae]MBP3950314.1 Holliday junction resolvase RecU [Bacillus suaedae]
MKVNYGNRGMAFEQLINIVNEQYLVQDIALINKRPTPVKVLKSRGTRVLKGYYEDRSTVDYDGTYTARSVAFEAKTVGEKRFDLKNLKTHQMQSLFNTNMHGGISFLLIEIRPVYKVFYVPFDLIRRYWKDAALGGRKSIPLEDLERYAYEVKQGRGVLLDYLAVLDRIEHEKVMSG